MRTPKLAILAIFLVSCYYGVKTNKSFRATIAAPSVPMPTERALSESANDTDALGGWSLGSNSKSGSRSNVNVYSDDTDNNISYNTAIIITSSWIPTHPSTDMIDTVIDSIKNLKGLQPATPIYLSVDHVPPPKTPLKNTKEDWHEADTKRATLDAYTTALYAKYFRRPNFHIMPSMDHGHISGGVRKAMDLIPLHYPNVEFVYYVQHDFSFKNEVDHTNLVELMKHNPEVNYVRFRYKKNEQPRRCPIGARNITQVWHGNTTVVRSAKYSDNNHLVRYDWYKKEVIDRIGAVPRPPEAPMMNRAEKKNECLSMGLYIYGNERGDLPVLAHLDGRKTENFTAPIADS